MFYRLLADFLVLIHFSYVLFIIGGYIWTIYSIIVKNKKFISGKFLRTFHLCGILYVALLIIIKKPCPITIWEIELRIISGIPSYTGSFIIHYIEKLLYPDVNPLVLWIPSFIIGGTTLLLYILIPPFKKRKII